VAGWRATLIALPPLQLQPGTRLGPYEIDGAIGAGGMGEVYRARDTQLNRSVAIKILPELFAADAERVARFTREAQTLAALNHSNIAQIYAVADLPAEAGRDEIYVRPFPGPGVKQLVSEGGGVNPIWSRDGRELFYRRGTEVVAVGVETESGFTVGKPAVLFSGRIQRWRRFEKPL
jgi:hypothetical protein